MNTSTTRCQLISLFADGELDDSEQLHVLALLRQSEGSRKWDEYHLVGDLLRSTDMAGEVRPGFAACFSARLAAEPAFLNAESPLGGASKEPAASRRASRNRMYRLAAPGAAIAAAVLLTIAALPHLSGLHAGAAGGNAALLAHVSARPESIALSSERATLRDARIDEYLQAHQRFSPSLYTTAQYSRAAAFAVEKDK